MAASSAAMATRMAWASPDAVAASSEAAGIATRQARPGSRLAENKGAAAATDVNAALEALIKEDEKRRAKAEKAGEKTDTSNAEPDDHSSMVKDETLYRSTFIPVAALGLVGPQLGLASRALEYAVGKPAEDSAVIEAMWELEAAWSRSAPASVRRATSASIVPKDEIVPPQIIFAPAEIDQMNKEVLAVNFPPELLRRLGCDVEHDIPSAIVTIDVPAVLGHQADYEGTPAAARV